MNPWRLFNDLLEYIDRLRRQHTFEFWATIYLLIFFGPVVWMIVGDLIVWAAPVTPGTAAVHALRGD